MILTLHRYILREQFKVLLLTLTALTVVVVLCGGLLNVVRSYGVSMADILKLIGYLVPVTITFVLPFAALFSTTAVYGRMSYDNEITACRAGSIDILRLFCSAVLIGILATGFTTYSLNFMIPSFIKGVQRYLSKDIEVRLFNQFKKRGWLKMRNIVVYADDVQDVTTARQRAEGICEAVFAGTAFMELEHGQLAQYGTADGARLRLYKRNVPPIGVAMLINPRGVDTVKNQVGQLSEQPLVFPLPPANLTERVQWFDLPRLFELRHHPARLAQIQNQLNELYQIMHMVVFYEDMVTELNRNHKYVLGSDDGQYRIEVRAAGARPSPDTREPRITGGVTVIEHRGDGSIRRSTAAEAVVHATIGPSVAGTRRKFTRALAIIELIGNVVSKDTRWESLRGEVKRKKLQLLPVAVPRRLIAATERIPEQRVLDRSGPPIPENNLVKRKRRALWQSLTQAALRINSQIHFRLGFSLGTIWLVILGAALAIIFRGGHVLVALALGFVPFMVQVIMLLAGKTLAEKPGTIELGIGLIWASNVMLVLLDGLVVGRFLRR